MPLYKFGCSYVMLYNIQNAWCLFCLFCDYWFEIINYNMQYIYIYTYVLQMSCMWIKDGFHFLKWAVQWAARWISILESCGLSTISILESSGQPYLHGKIPMGNPPQLPTELPTFYIFGSSWLPIASIYGSSGQPNLHGEIPLGSPICCPLSCPRFNIWKQWAAYWAAHWAAHCSHIWK